MNTAAASKAFGMLQELGICPERAEFLLKEIGIDDPEKPWDPIQVAVAIVSILHRLDALEHPDI